MQGLYIVQQIFCLFNVKICIHVYFSVAEILLYFIFKIQWHSKIGLKRHLHVKNLTKSAQ